MSEPGTRGRRSSLGRVLVVSFAGVAVAGVALTALITIVLARAGAPGRAIAELRSEATSGAELAAGLPCDVGPRPGGQLARELGPRARFVPDDAPRGRFPAAGFPEDEGEATVGGRDVLYSSARATLCGRPGTLYVTRPSTDVPILPDGFGSRLILAAIAAVLISMLVAYPLARRLAQPLAELARTARAFARGSREPAPPRAADPAEVADLKHAMDDMMSDLASAKDREKAFLLSVSHELRTPLTAIRGYGEALADGATSKPREAGAVVVRESQRLERLVQDLLDLARLEAGEFSVHRTDVDLREVAEDVRRGLQPFASDNRLAVEVEGDGAHVVATDRDRVHQILANLVENALRVSAAGTTVVIETGPRMLAVRDRGPGIDEADLGRAFERFYLWTKYKGERRVGSGLGLAIVAELAKRLDAEVTVRSQDVGSRFEITFTA